MNKKIYFLSFFVGMQILLIILQIHKQSSFIKLSFEKQRLEKEQRELIAEHNTLNERLNKLQDPEAIKKYALQTLHMKHIALNQIRHAHDSNQL
ncbi:MAG: hypothetical protein AB7F19_05180 [Candidatus Babeliales bacterium]